MVDYEDELYLNLSRRDDFLGDYDFREEREGSRESDYDDRDWWRRGGEYERDLRWENCWYVLYFFCDECLSLRW